MTYELSARADLDMVEIYRFGHERFGEARADDYYLALVDAFEAIASDPLRYPMIDDRYRRAVHRSNSIYFRVVDDGLVRIVRVLDRQDIKPETFG